MITPFPEIRCTPMNEKNDFMIIACDGIWDVYTNQNAIALAYNTRK